MDLHQALNRFPTAEVASITAVPHATLRTWRTRGQLPEDKHWTDSYDSLQVCALAVRKAMTAQGARAKETGRLGPRYAPAVLKAALRHAPQLVELRGNLVIIAKACSDNDYTTAHSEAVIKSETADAVLARIVGGSDDMNWRYLVSADQRPYEAAYGLDEHLHAEVVSLRCIDLHALGGKIALLATRPLLFLGAP